MISADVSGRLALEGGTVCANPGLNVLGAMLYRFGEDGADTPLTVAHPDTILFDCDRLIIFNPRALFTRLFGAIPTPLDLPWVAPPPAPNEPPSALSDACDDDDE